jgi:hypothetical protein
MPSDSEFARIRAPTFSRSPCSPTVGDDRAFRGIRIDAPREVAIDEDDADARTGAFAHAIVCGAYRLDANYLDLRQRFLPRVFVVATDPARQRAYAGRLLGGPSQVEPPNPLAHLDLAPEDWVGRVVNEYFNTNLVLILGLPPQSATYFVHATIGGYVSNVIKMTLKRRA